MPLLTLGLKSFSTHAGCHFRVSAVEVSLAIILRINKNLFDASIEYISI
jgi:hypothetical protein